ncbi:hypothetical protein PENSPDRAFT_612317 [Peniophora sp. CONT]|nr:hypothetical protein PENSPDRAFT_612317 [Peniophora sp. CONT]
MDERNRTPTIGEGYSQHDRFWYDDKMLYLAVSNHVLYKLPLFLFPESTYLSSLTCNYKPDPRKDNPLPQLPLIDVDGTVYYVLEDVTSTELDALLSILTPSYIESRPEVASYEGLAAVLKLSTRWGLSSVRRFVLRRLDEIMQPVQRLALARSCDVDKWVSRALVTLCERSEPLSLDDILQMTPEDIALVTQVREQARAPASPVTLESADVVRLIEDLSASIRMRRKKLGAGSSAVKARDPESLRDDEPGRPKSAAARDHSPISSPPDAPPETSENTQPIESSAPSQPTFVFGQPLSTTPGDRPFTPELPQLPTPLSGTDSGTDEDQSKTVEKAKLEIKSPRLGKPMPVKIKRRLRDTDVMSSQPHTGLGTTASTLLAATDPAK